MREADRQYLLELAEELEGAKRLGASVDAPEGACYLVISDTLARQVSQRLRGIAYWGMELPLCTCGMGDGSVPELHSEDCAIVQYIREREESWRQQE
jgi:hypothetical protein